MEDLYPLDGYLGLYSITKSGKVFSYRSLKYLKPLLSGCRYYNVALYNSDSMPKRLLIHRLLAITFIENLENLPEVNHRDGNKLNNSLENLEWVSSSQNKKHAWDSGLMEKNREMQRIRGHSNARLMNMAVRKQVIDITTKEKFVSITEAARKYGLDPSKLGKRLNGKLPNNTKLRFL